MPVELYLVVHFGLADLSYSCIVVACRFENRYLKYLVAIISDLYGNYH